MEFSKLCYGCMKEKKIVGGYCPNCGFNNDDYRWNENHLPPLKPLNGRYLTGRVLGAGGFGITYLAKDIKLEKVVAIKELFLKNISVRKTDGNVTVSLKDNTCFEDNKKRFQEEARILARFKDTDKEGVVGVQDYFEENNTAYIVMEYIQGTTLRQMFKNKPITYEAAVDLLNPITSTLIKIHHEKVVHLDISPDNIMITEDGKAKLLDFGGAKLINDTDPFKQFSYKRGYSPIEQRKTTGKLGRWTDVYAMAATMYYCITGKKPVDAMDRLAGTELPFPSRLGAKIPEKAEAVLMKALELQIEDRYQTLEEFWEDVCAPLKGKPVGIKPLTLAVSIALFMIGCSSVFFLLRPVPDAESISIVAPSNFFMDGEEVQLGYNVYPDRAKPVITWNSSNERIATIDEKGLLNAKTAGVVTISISTDNEVVSSENIEIVSNCTTVYDGIDYSPVYDYNFYAETYPEIAEQFLNDPVGAIEFFVNSGIQKGQQGIADFNVLGYAHSYKDLRKAFGSDLYAYVMHYINTGKAEGRKGLGESEIADYETVYNDVDYRLVYDYNYYIKENPDVYEQFNVDDTAVLEYFVENGIPLGVQGCSSFNPVSYAYKYPEVRERCRKPYEEYIAAGVFDYAPYYLDYINTGCAEGLSAVEINSMQAYLTVFDGTDYSDEYDYNVYCENNPDLNLLFGVDDAAVLEHYVKYGKSENRIAK